MENLWDEIDANLGKLRRNEEQMTPEQREKYKKPLMALQKKVQAQATKICNSFVLGGIRIKKGEFTKEMEDSLKGMIAEEQPKIDAAGKILFSTYSVDKFLEALCPVESRIFHEWYGPYWIAHCILLPDGTIYNDIIDMEWNSESRIWMKSEPLTWTCMLPPTMEEIMKEYKEDKNA